MCGIIGIISQKPVVNEIYNGLIWLNHRGQDGVGILTYDQDHGIANSGIHRIRHRMRKSDRVSEVFDEQELLSLKGNIGIGQVKYSTAGTIEEKDIQPFFDTYPGVIGIVHNGNTVNYLSLKNKLVGKRRGIFSSCDSEIILKLFTEQYSKEKQTIQGISSSVQEIYNKVCGAYSVVLLIIDKGLLAFRDPQGIRPLLFGKGEKSYAFGSENYALEYSGYSHIEDINPGEMIFIDQNLKIYRRQLIEENHAHCAFEYVYFSAPDSIFERVSISQARKKLGISLAKKFRKKRIKADMVVPVPDTSRTAAESLAKELEIPCEEGLLRNRYGVGRTFILPNQTSREQAVRLKFKPETNKLKGKKIILLDDSIVRGTTLEGIIDLVKKAGAKKVYAASTFPPIRYPCYLGIDFQSKGELIAVDRTITQIRKEIGADELIFNNPNDLKSGIGLDDICLACVNGNYPVDISEAVILEKLRKKHKENS